MEWILVASKASSKVMSGRMEGRRFASMLFPEPGGPSSSTLWPPPAAISSARLTSTWPLTSAKSRESPGSGRLSTGLAGERGASPERWSSSWRTFSTG